MSLEDRLRRIVTALPGEASVTLPVLLVKEWLEMEADDPLADLTVADVALQLSHSPGTWNGDRPTAAEFTLDGVAVG